VDLRTYVDMNFFFMFSGKLLKFVTFFNYTVYLYTGCLESAGTPYK